MNQTNNFENSAIDNLKIDKNLIDRVFKYASVKNIWNKTSKDEKIESILNEVIRDLKNLLLKYKTSRNFNSKVVIYKADNLGVEFSNILVKNRNYIDFNRKAPGFAYNSLLRVSNKS